jgi:hypothetical protein
MMRGERSSVIQKFLPANNLLTASHFTQSMLSVFYQQAVTCLLEPRTIAKPPFQGKIKQSQRSSLELDRSAAESCEKNEQRYHYTSRQHDGHHYLILSKKHDSKITPEYIHGDVLSICGKYDYRNACLCVYAAYFKGGAAEVKTILS